MNKSVGYYLARFALYYVVVMAALYAIVVLLIMVAPDFARSLLTGGGGSGLGVTAFIVPVLLLAQLFWRHEGRRETRSEGWTLAIAGTVIGFVLSAGVFTLLQIVAPDRAMLADLAQVWSEVPGLILGLSGVIGLIYLVGFRLMFWAGLRGETKKAERLAARKQK